jgi:hypothetical protein
MFFEVKVEFRTIDPNSEKVKKETVKYLVESESVTESEALVYQHFEELRIKDFEVKASNHSKIADIIYPLKK